MKRPGHYVEITNSVKSTVVQRGIIYNREEIQAPIGKLVVHLIDDKFQPIMENEKQKIKFCKPNELTLIGYVD